MAIIKGGKTLAPWKKSYDKHRQCLKKQRHHFADKSLYSQSYGFSGSYVWMWELDHKEGWTLKNWCFQILVLEKTLESPWRSNQSVLKEINPDIHRKDCYWSWSSNTLATWCKELTHWKRPWCWERLRAGGEAGDRETGWLDGLVTSLT